MMLIGSRRGTRSGSGLLYRQKVLGYLPLAYWPLNEAGGVVAYDLSGNGYNASIGNAVPGQAGIGDGGLCPWFDGTNDYVYLYSAALSAAWGTPAAGTALLWLKVAGSGVWTDGAARRGLSLQNTSANQIVLGRPSNNGSLYWEYRANSVVKTLTLGSQSSVGWLCLGLTWDTATGEAKWYLGGAQQGATVTGIGTWSAAGFNASWCVLGVNNVSAYGEDWYGYLAHCALWARALTPAQMADLAAV
jgi:hypothetical protein